MPPLPQTPHAPVPRPNFFIVGAPKCGTTSLHHYLGLHPDIFVPKRKELHYFGSDLEFRKAPRIERSEYLAQFQEAAGQRAIGEASVWYLYSERAAQEIFRFNRRAKIIILLRNPVDMLPSLHSQFLYECNDDLLDFEQALAAEPLRRRGLQVPTGVYFERGLQYRSVARYTEQVRRYLNTFGRDRVHVIDFDDLRRNPPLVYRDTLRFLGVQDQFVPPFVIKNSNSIVRHHGFQHFLNNPPRPVLQLARLLLPTPLRHPLVDLLKRLNSRRAPRPPLPDSLKQQLQAEFRGEVHSLGQLLGRDLSHWCGASVVAAPPVGEPEYLIGSGAFAAVST